MPLIVRQAKKTDFESILSLYNEFNKAKLSLGQFLGLVKAARGRDVIFCIEMTKKIVGYIIVKTYVDVEEAGVRAEITDFFVSLKARGIGAGRTLLAQAIKFCKKKGARKIILQTRSYQVRAYKLYQKARFKKTGIITLHRKL